MGEIFERMVGSIKRCLKKILLSERIAFEEPETILRETDLPLNNGQITFNYGIGDKLLTVSHLIYGPRLNTISINQSEEEHIHTLKIASWFK